MRVGSLLRQPALVRLALLAACVVGLSFFEGWMRDSMLERYSVGGPVHRSLQAQAEVLEELHGIRSDLDGGRIRLMYLPHLKASQVPSMVDGMMQYVDGVEARFRRISAMGLPEEVRDLVIPSRNDWDAYRKEVRARVPVNGSDVTLKMLDPLVTGATGRRYARMVQQLEAARNVMVLRVDALGEEASALVRKRRRVLETVEWGFNLLILVVLGVAARTAVKMLRQQERRERHVTLRGEVAQVLSTAGETKEALQRSCEALTHHLDTGLARVWLLDASGTTLELRASAGVSTRLDGPHGQLPLSDGQLGRIARERFPVVRPGPFDDGVLEAGTWAGTPGPSDFLGQPLAVGDRVVGLLGLFGRRPFHLEELEVVGGIADILAQGIERRRAEQSLKERAEDLSRSNSELEQFAYVASHDLQEPLRMVSSYTRLLSRRYKGKLDQDADDYIQYAVDGAVRMQKLIQDLLSFSRVGTKGAPLVPVRVDDVVSRALKNLEVAIQESGTEVAVTDPLPEVMADGGQLEQLFQNLAGNALKFRAPERKPRIQIRAERLNEREWRFDLEDNGIGIEPQYFERIFVLFQRLHTRAEYEGTGIGLAVCKKIVERHGGRIWVTSRPGEGSTFSFVLRAVEEGRTALGDGGVTLSGEHRRPATA
ncbi:MAG TPA: ATP-binding protein [Myxococcaceae bacterium]|nr:ATP-binding protein [Myxococcaceae bacterium]